MSNLIWTGQAEKEYNYWVRHNPKIATRIDRIIDNISRDPFQGLGKPEPLKHDLHGMWSRRITDSHRIIYDVIEDKITIYSCFGHY